MMMTMIIIKELKTAHEVPYELWPPGLIHHLYDPQGDINNVWPVLAYICSQQTIS